ncbi:MAG: hypothetical protein AAF514_02050 [Verrucomicrobiota bacterium]
MTLLVVLALVLATALGIAIGPRKVSGLPVTPEISEATGERIGFSDKLVARIRLRNHLASQNYVPPLWSRIRQFVRFHTYNAEDYAFHSQLPCLMMSEVVIGNRYTKEGLIPWAAIHETRFASGKRMAVYSHGVYNPGAKVAEVPLPKWKSLP